MYNGDFVLYKNATIKVYLPNGVSEQNNVAVCVCDNNMVLTCSMLFEANFEVWGYEDPWGSVPIETRFFCSVMNAEKSNDKKFSDEEKSFIKKNIKIYTNCSYEISNISL